jgi:hypothetical protein
MSKGKIVMKIFSVAMLFLLMGVVLSFSNNTNLCGAVSDVLPDESNITFDFAQPEQTSATANVTATSFRFPLDGSWSVTLGFGDIMDSGRHLGEDVYRPEGTRVYAAANGIVRFAGSADGYGSAVVIEHWTGIEFVRTFYGHLSSRLGLQVSPGQEVSKGQLIGYIAYDDEDGGDWSPHLHFGVRKGAYETQAWVYYDYGTFENMIDWYDPTDFISSHQLEPQEQSLVSPSDGSYQDRVYWLQNGKLYWITEYIDNNSGLGATIDGMSSLPGWGWSKINEFSSSLLMSYSGWPDGVARFIAAGSESNGLLLCKAGDTNVYLTQNGRKIWFPDPTAVEHAGFSLADVIYVPDNVLNLFLGVTDDAQEVGRSSTVVVAPGESFSIWFGVRNIGTSTWTEGLQYCLGWHSGFESFPNSESLKKITLSSSENITPGMTKNWSVGEIKAPSSPGTYTAVWQMLRENVYWFGDSAYIQVTVVQRSQPPYVPSKPSGSRYGYTGTFYSYSTSTTDPDGDEVKYTFDWGDGSNSETDYVSSGTLVSLFHSWSEAGTYSVRVKATDGGGALSGWSDSQEVTIDSLPESAPSAPTLSSPADGAVISGTSVTFEWDSYPEANKYFLEVNADPDWAEEGRKFYGEMGELTKEVTDFNDDGTEYYWRVKARNVSGWGSWSGARSFINMSEPSAPSLSSPQDGDEVPGTSVTFKWEASEGATKYLLEVNTDPNWGKKTSKFYGDVGNVTEYKDTGYPDNVVTYYWRVLAGNEAGWGPPSSTWSFINAGPTLISPEDGEAVPGTSVTFKWEASEGATKYLLEVNTDPDWSKETSKFYGNMGDITEYEDTGYPNDGTIYYWRVRAGNEAGWSSRSETRRFINTSVEEPLAPTLTSPEDGAKIFGTAVTLVWGASERADNYWLEVNSSSSWDKAARKFSGCVGDVTEYEDTGYLNNDNTYYWRVRAGNVSGWSSWSEGWSFINTSRPAPALTSPEDDEVVPGKSVTFQWGASAGATTYQLEVNVKPDSDVNTEPDWGEATRKYKGDVGNVLTKIVTGFGDDGRTYYWRVRAGSDAGWSSWSETGSFVNASVEKPSSAPILSSPADGARACGTSVTFEWKPSSGATNYQLEVNSSPFWDKRTRKYRGSVDDVCTKTVTDFKNDGTRYYWRVRARNTAGWSDWSESLSFLNGPP